jgi:cytochrome c oxidase subunit II
VQARRWLQRGLAARRTVPLIAACEFSGPQSALDPAGPVAQAQKDLFIWTYWLSWPVMIGVFGVLIYASGASAPRTPTTRRRSRTRRTATPKLEIAWTIVPVILVVLVAVPTVRTIFATEQRVTAGPDDVVVHATGYQWWFKFEYPDLGITTANELIIPVGQRVVVSLDSADVLHSFWVPNLAGKRDMIPNQDNQVWFIADAPGVYYGQCAELCLGAHAYMRFRVIAKERPTTTRGSPLPEREPHRSSPPTRSSSAAGSSSPRRAASAATRSTATPGVAVGNPDFPEPDQLRPAHHRRRAIVDNTPENLAAWLRDPQAMKPGNRMPTLWSADDPNREEEIEAIVAYLSEPRPRRRRHGAAHPQGGLHGGQ